MSAGIVPTGQDVTRPGMATQDLSAGRRTADRFRSGGMQRVAASTTRLDSA